MSGSQLTHMVTQQGRNDEFALIVAISWACHSRVQSVLRPLDPYRARGNLLSEEQVGNKAVIGFVNRKLIIQLRLRKHVTSGSQIARGRICEGYLPKPPGLRVPQLLCPVRCLWPAIAAHGALGNQVPPQWVGKKALAAIRNFTMSRGRDDRGRLGRPPPRGGAARPLTQAGGSLIFLGRPSGVPWLTASISTSGARRPKQWTSFRLRHLIGKPPTGVSFRSK